MIGWDRVAAFADEAAVELDAQLACLDVHGIGLLECRSVGGRSVVGLDDEELRSIRRRLDAAGVGVCAIGSPVGKTQLTDGWPVVEQQLVRALRAASILGCGLVRVFSFYLEPGSHAAHRPQVMDNLSRMAALAGAEGVLLVHENERGIYGDTPERCHDILTTVASPALAACFDVANFIQCRCMSAGDAWDLLGPHVRHVHVKDAQADGTVAPAGKGIGDWPGIIDRLVSSGYRGFLSLEPHLDGVVPGSGCARLGVAADALRALLRSDAHLRGR